jgi:hypothetical protein
MSLAAFLAKHTKNWVVVQRSTALLKTSRASELLATKQKR